ncbi:MAG: hypothetical protein ACXACI_14170 [Candidatus Hodarchaeales archaeon]
MDIKAFMTEHLTKEDLLDLAEKVELRREMGLERIWKDYVTVKDVLSALDKRKVKKLKKLSSEELDELAVKAIEGRIDIFAVASGKKEKERQRASALLDLIDGLFWEKINSKSSEKIAELLVFLPNFDVDDLREYFNLDKQQQISDKLAIQTSDLNLESFPDRDILWDRIVGTVHPKALNFEETFKEGRTSRRRYLRWWDEQQRRVAGLYAAAPEFSTWQESQSEYRKLLNSGKSKDELDFSHISYIFSWISNLTKGLAQLSERMANLESHLGSPTAKKTEKVTINKKKEKKKLSEDKDKTSEAVKLAEEKGKAVETIEVAKDKEKTVEPVKPMKDRVKEAEKKDPEQRDRKRRKEKRRDRKRRDRERKKRKIITHGSKDQREK